MISEEIIKKLVTDKIENTDKFIVGVKIRPVNKIEVLIDSINNIAINDCITISKYIESNLDRDQEDFELTVSSAGIDEPFKVIEQYIKNVGREILVSPLDEDQEKISGKLLNIVNESEIEVQIKKTERKEIGKGKVTRIENVIIPLNQVKETKLVLSFNK
jgi:ribosome maturation factor RimP